MSGRQNGEAERECGDGQCVSLRLVSSTVREVKRLAGNKSLASGRRKAGKGKGRGKDRKDRKPASG